VAGIGDINGDSFDDVLVGAPGSVNVPEGTIYAYSGRDGSIIYSHLKLNIGFGSRIDAVGDMNADGVSEYVAALPTFSNQGTNRGRVWLYSGKNAQILHFFDGDSPWDFFGFSVSAAGDVNQDGIPDFIVGAPSSTTDQPPNEGGYATVYAGNDLWLRAIPQQGVSLGDSITLTTALGVPGMPAMLFLTEFNGTPLFRPVTLSGVIDPDGNWAVSATVPTDPNLTPGTTLSLRSYSLDRAGRLIDTWNEPVLIQ
jgi:hypothetical protein